jgi:hypothetical protein
LNVCTESPWKKALHHTGRQPGAIGDNQIGWCGKTEVVGHTDDESIGVGNDKIESRLGESPKQQKGGVRQQVLENHWALFSL